MTPEEREILIRIDERVAKLSSDMGIVCSFRQSAEKRISKLEARADDMDQSICRVDKLESYCNYLLLSTLFLALLVLGRFLPLNMP